jgi:cell wall-associated NlpC family hydrolase
LSHPASERAAVVREAMTWLGTAFHHRGRVRAVRDAAGRIVDRGGVDCAQSVYLIYRAALPALVPEIAAADGAYAFQWNLSRSTASEEGYLTAVLAHAHEISGDAVGAGDLALFRVGLAWAHGAIVMPPGWPAIAHANIDGGAFMLDRADRGRLARRKIRFFTLWPKEAS